MLDEDQAVEGDAAAPDLPDIGGQQEPPEAAGASRRGRRTATRPAGPPEAPLEDDVSPGDQPRDVGEAVTTEGEQPAEGEPRAQEPAEGGSEGEQPVEASQEQEPVAEVAPLEPEVSEADGPGSEDPSSHVHEEPAGFPKAEGEPEPPVRDDEGTSQQAPVRRSRRATRPVTTVAFSGEPPEALVVAPRTPPEASVVALFQPPDATRAVPGTRPRGEEQAAEGQAEEEPGVSPEAPGSEALLADAGAEEGAEGEHEDEGGARRRRRRGGRRRRRPGQPTDDELAAEQEEQAAAAGEGEPGGTGEGTETGLDVPGGEEAGEGPETAEEHGEETSSARRRRRRRRRAGVSEEMEDLSSDDPPNTVVKVREARPLSDEITSVRGSTRIEAKKQRRRDGRDAGRRRAPILTEAEFLARRESVNRVMCVRQHGSRTQIAVLEDGVLVEHYVSRADSSSMVGNVYLGRVQNVLPSMEAAFVDIGRGRNAVLYAGEVNWDAAGLEGQPKRIELALKSGDSVLVQVTKDPIGHKGARLTSQISLPGRFLVYVPEGSMTGISRKLPDTERARLKGILKDIVPEGAGVIVRTAAEGAAEDQLASDVRRLTAQWTDITKKARSAAAPSLLYGEPDLAIKVVRDIFNEDFTTLLVQGRDTWQTLNDYIGWVAPDLLHKLSQWVEPTDLYSANRIDEQLAKALDRKVWLPSGGSLVIDRTEAMTVIDVNTGRFTGQGGNLEETVTRNNLEAAEEIVRQLRLRDIGGIIVVDFIDMVLESNRDLVLRRLVECLGRDRTKHQVAEVTSLGLVQMTRKRIGQGLLEAFSVACEHCNGRGFVILSEPSAVEPASEPSRAADQRGSRRNARQSPVHLGGKQTGHTPPPPRFDEHGHIEPAPDRLDVAAEHAERSPAELVPVRLAAGGVESVEMPAVPQDEPTDVVREGRDVAEPGEAQHGQSVAEPTVQADGSPPDEAGGGGWKGAEWPAEEAWDAV